MIVFTRLSQERIIFLAPRRLQVPNAGTAPGNRLAILQSSAFTSSALKQ